MSAALLELNVEMETHLRQEDHPSAVLAAAPPGVSRPPGILVIDDEAFLRAMLYVELRQEGFAVWQARDGWEGLALYQCHRSEIDLVLLDVHMPGLDGLQTLAALRQLDPQIRCCFLSGHGGAHTDEQLLGQGALAVLNKSYHLANVALALGQLLGLSPRPIHKSASGRSGIFKWVWDRHKPAQPKDILRMIRLEG